MAFSEEIVRQAWERAGGQCECTRRSHSHFYSPCGKALVRSNRGKMGPGGWEVHPATSSGGNTIANCEVLCWHCHEATYQ